MTALLKGNNGPFLSETLTRLHDQEKDGNETDTLFVACYALVQADSGHRAEAVHGYRRWLTYLATARWFAVVVFALCFHANSYAHPNRITGEIDDSPRFTLRGHLHRQAQSLYDQGRTDSYLRIERLTLVLKPSDTQAAELALAWGTPISAIGNYHKWLTPETYADRFGLSQSDIAKIVEWLTAQQLTVTGVSRARRHPGKRKGRTH